MCRGESGGKGEGGRGERKEGKGEKGRGKGGQRRQRRGVVLGSPRPPSLFPLPFLRFPRLLTLLLCVALLAATLACAAPGEGRKAAGGYALSEPIIDALARYHDATGTYPDTLESLVPDYLEAVPETYDNLPLVYEQTGTGYTLQFSYTRPGMNECVYTPDAGWSCSGYF
jgi:hypothetical protein